MGWTSYYATHYKNGKIDRKAECDQLFNWEDENRKCEVLKSSMVGSTYYAAVRSLNKTNGYERVCAAICLTSTNAKDYYNFAYKDMDETCGPYKYDCPIGILNLLTPTENEYALEWRKKCYEKLDRKKSKTSLSTLPEGSVIKVVLPFDTQRHKAGTEVVLTKRKWGKQCKWFTSSWCYFTRTLMKSLEEYCVIVKRGE